MVSSLNITKIGLLDAGIYQCVAGYGVHKVFDWMKIIVRGPPLVKSMQNLTLLINDHAQIDCPVVGWPIDSIIWLKGKWKLSQGFIKSDTWIQNHLSKCIVQEATIVD